MVGSRLEHILDLAYPVSSTLMGAAITGQIKFVGIDSH
jgi:hypothetical protein